MFKYELYAITSQFDEYKKKISRKNELSQIQKDNLSGNYADYIASKNGMNVVIYGCNEINDED